MNGKEQLLSDLINMFEVNQPDEEDYLEDDPDIAGEIDSIQEMINDDSVTLDKKIEVLYDFNKEWFPDGLPESEKKELHVVLDKVSAIIGR